MKKIIKIVLGPLLVGIILGLVVHYVFDNDQNVKTNEVIKETKVESKVPSEYTDALNKASEYQETICMSENGLKKQLESKLEKFSKEAVKYALEHLNTNYQICANKKSQTYLDMNMSPKAIEKQLTSFAEGFTTDQARTALKELQKETKDVNNKPREYTNALNKAIEYQKTICMSEKGLKKQLESNLEKFSKEAVKYALENINTNYQICANKKAQTYLDMKMSPSEIEKQLTSFAEGYTTNQATTALKELQK